jgi:hypothetical protein
MIEPSAQRAVFLVGQVPLGMATSTSDLDFIVLVDNPSVLLAPDAEMNGGEHQEFSGDCDRLRAGASVTNRNGISINITAVITPMIAQIYRGLRKRGPELSETEIMTLGWLSSGWLLWESQDYLALRGVQLSDRALDVYCSTKNFSYALIYRRKAAKVLESADVPLALHLGRSSIEMAYLAYFASEGLSYLGPKWLAQLGYARGSMERVSRSPLLKEGISLLFPSCGSSVGEAQNYLREVSRFLTSLRELVGRKSLFRIAFDACPQIFPA